MFFFLLTENHFCPLDFDHLAIWRGQHEFLFLPLSCPKDSDIYVRWTLLLTEQKYVPAVLSPALDTSHLLKIARNNATGKK